MIWAQKIDFYIKSLDYDLNQVQQMKPRSSRLDLLEKAFRHNRDSLSQLFRPFFQQSSYDFDQLRALKTQMPLQQQLMGYESNIFRDWAWKNTNENQASMDLLTKNFKRPPAGAKVLVLGAGAGRLTYDLHQHFDFASTIALDFNPFLLLIAAKMFRGEEVQLYDTPVVPKDESHVAVLETLKAPGPTKPGLQTVFADALNAPFQNETFDLVLTPWFIDVIPLPFSELSKKINALLKPHGHWWNFGPFGFLQSPVSARPSSDEMMKSITGLGFQVEQQSKHWLPYLDSPASAQKRQELVFLFSAEKISACEPAKSFEPTADWILDFDKPIPLEPWLPQYRQANKAQFEILGLVDGKKSINQIAQEISQTHGIPQNDSIAGFLNLMTQLRPPS